MRKANPIVTWVETRLLISTGESADAGNPWEAYTYIWDSAGNDVQHRIDSEYFAAYRRLEEGIRVSQRLMGDPIEVARLIASVMAAKKPKSRYLIGYDARAIDIYSKLLPTQVRDRLARITLGL